MRTERAKSGLEFSDGTSQSRPVAIETSIMWSRFPFTGSHPQPSIIDQIYMSGIVDLASAEHAQRPSGQNGTDPRPENP